MPRVSRARRRARGVSSASRVAASEFIWMILGGLAIRRRRSPSGAWVHWPVFSSPRSSAMHTTPSVNDYLRTHIRTVPDWPAPGVQFRDITPLLQDPQVLDRKSTRLNSSHLVISYA